MAATTFTIGLIGNVANANPAAPIVQQQDKKDVKAPKSEPQKKDVQKQTPQEPAKDHNDKAPQHKKNQPPKVR